MRSHLDRRGLAAAVVILIAGVGVAAQQPAQQDYQIKLHRHSVAGRTYRFVASAAQSQTTVMTVDAQTGPSEDVAIAADLTGQLTTLAVTAHGKDAKVSLVIEQSKCAADGVTSPLLPPGTTVVAVRDGETTMYSVNDAPVNPRAARCLRIALPLNTDGKATDDDIFGTRARQKVGSAWPMNSTLAAEDLLAGSGLMVAPRDVSGSTRLTELTSFNDRPALRIDGEMALKNVSVPLPAGVTVRLGQFRAALSAVLPVDPARTDGQMSMKMAGRIECDGAVKGHVMRLIMTMTQRIEHTLTLQEAEK